MKSREESSLLDLEKAIPTTETDIRALRQIGSPKLDFEGYLDFLESLGDEDPACLRRRQGPKGDSFFEL